MRLYLGHIFYYSFADSGAGGHGHPVLEILNLEMPILEMPILETGVLEIPILEVEISNTQNEVLLRIPIIVK